MSTSKTDNSHRPWPAPSRPWALRMRWVQLLFAHWTVEADTVRGLLPRGLELDLFEGRCYVGVVPFLMEDTAPRYVPAIPGLSAFPELNLRTYVQAGGKSGVWFFSLDAANKLAVRGARTFFHLPYFDASMKVTEGLSVAYRSTRTHSGASLAEFDAVYRPTGAIYRAAPGSLDSWLTDRYCLYSADKGGKLYRCEIEHDPWPLRPAEAEIRTNTLGDRFGFPLRRPPELLHFSARLDVHAWMLDRV